MDAMSRVFGERPDRPSHPDFWRMSEVVLALDGNATEGARTLPETAEGLIDMDSLMYVATQRVSMFMQALRVTLTPKEYSMMMTVFVTSIITGIEFERAGGHREP